MSARRKPMTLLDAIHDRNLFAPWFRKPSWAAWFVFLRALFALPMSDDELAVYQQCTGRDTPPSTPASEGWLICGRRAGKSFMLALVAVFLACFKDYRPHLAPGERGTLMVIAADRRQSRTIFRYIRALLNDVPMLRRMVERETADAFDLTNKVSIEVAVASFRSTRGYTLVAALADEISFWPTDDAAEPDYEVLHALRPGMITIPGAMLLCASSPYARKGALWDAFRRHYGKDSPVLVWKAATRTMNPTVPQSVIDAAMEADPAAASAEYNATFRTDVETYISRETVDAAVVVGRAELPRTEGVYYTGFVDPSGGSNDSMTLAICHIETSGRLVLDLLRERKPPFSPDNVAAEFSELLKAYSISTVHGDRYAGEWPRERFRVHGIEYRVAAKPKSDIYRDLLPILNAGRAELLDHPRLIAQLCSLERRTARGGRDSIDHPVGSHDDVCNAVAGALVTASRVMVDDAPIVGCLVWSRNAGWGDTDVTATSQPPTPPAAERIHESMLLRNRRANEPWASWLYGDRW
jgi:hypothetical protein